MKIVEWRGRRVPKTKGGRAVPGKEWVRWEYTLECGHIEVSTMRTRDRPAAECECSTCEGEDE